MPLFPTGIVGNRVVGVGLITCRERLPAGLLTIRRRSTAVWVVPRFLELERSVRGLALRSLALIVLKVDRQRYDPVSGHWQVLVVE